MEKGEGYIESFICAINDLLYGKDDYITNDIVLEEMNRRFGGECKESDIKIYGSIANAMRAEYNNSLKKAKLKISKCLKSHGFEFDEIYGENDKRKSQYRYPKNLNFNPGEELLKEARPLRLSQLSDLIKSSVGLFPKSWLANFRLQLNKEIYADDQDKIIQFDSNLQLKNIGLVSEIYEIIKKKQVITFYYHPFGKNRFRVLLHPKFLKEYNNRWFVLGKGKAYKPFENYNFAIDRIESELEVHPEIQYEDNGIDYPNFYKSIVGVSEDSNIVKVVLEVEDEKVLGYLKTKPIISSQIIEGNTVTFPAVALNYEFVTHILEYADRVKVIEPVELGKQLIERVKDMYNNLKNFEDHNVEGA